MRLRALRNFSFHAMLASLRFIHVITFRRKRARCTFGLLMLGNWRFFLIERARTVVAKTRRTILWNRLVMRYLRTKLMSLRMVRRRAIALSNFSWPLYRRRY